MKDPADRQTHDVFQEPSGTKKGRGGRRTGAGMKQKYGEPTVTLRVPASRREGLETWLAALETLKKLQRLAQPNEEETARREYLSSLLETAERAFFDSVASSKTEPGAIPDDALRFRGGADRSKMLAGGFRIFRVYEDNKEIRELSHEGGWRLHARYDTKKAMRQAIKELLEDPMSIMD